MLKMFIESLKNLVSEPETIKYPFAPSPEPKGYRGTIHYNEELCIFCDKCENICPPGAIKFVVVDYETGKKEYNYNPYLCIYCGACVRECPKAEEGCLVQVETRTPPLGRSVPKGKELGYFINRIEDPKEVESKWREIEELNIKTKEEYKAYKKAKRAQKAAAKAKSEE
ncbi:4Fe-4S binding protein [Caminibacter pacificus]|jgi:NADH-quinone oxidoreductase subunit I|uniref:4Fe-4S dicluster domain-containing protein n=1 Tax=Caminibacter pacificus TaxID=1424653 RepID=A0AAJ4RDJ4_9BACT|nr:4Fe-4S binding protein [Caminibacter pacificus]NPA87069.1 4Fe-4S dicluster domain-containing protein [Campylobacterota bacterium]QCI28711.1 4Fe-4S dicluster domain-containing protein [Caminibacter pacificus]ROR40555.1 4Fe-4S dicluster protein [Caminibacter pacificus]